MIPAFGLERGVINVLAFDCDGALQRPTYPWILQVVGTIDLTSHSECRLGLSNFVIIYEFAMREILKVLEFYYDGDQLDIRRERASKFAIDLASGWREQIDFSRGARGESSF
ncbi:unnamed protein product [Calypogeia fissa]